MMVCKEQAGLRLDASEPPPGAEVGGRHGLLRSGGAVPPSASVVVHVVGPCFFRILVVFTGLGPVVLFLFLVLALSIVPARVRVRVAPLLAPVLALRLPAPAALGAGSGRVPAQGATGAYAILPVLLGGDAAAHGRE